MVKNTYLKGNNLTHEGKHCDRITFIIEGKVNVFAKDVNKNDKQIDTLAEGDMIGQWGIFNKSIY